MIIWVFIIIFSCTVYLLFSTLSFLYKQQQIFVLHEPHHLENTICHQAASLSPSHITIKALHYHPTPSPLINTTTITTFTIFNIDQASRHLHAHPQSPSPSPPHVTIIWAQCQGRLPSPSLINGSLWDTCRQICAGLTCTLV